MDMDGVVLRGDTPLPGALERVAELRESFRVVLLSNNSTMSRGDFEEKLESLGLDFPAEDVVNAAYATAAHLSQRGSLRVHPVGEAGLKRELEAAGHRVVESDADYVVAAMDRELTYGKLDSALQDLLGGAGFVATNEDPTFPVEDGLHPGAGCVVGAFRGMGYEPDAVLGKPDRDFMLYAADRAGADPSECVVVGDRPGTDVAGARNAGMKSVLVRSGVSGGEGGADLEVDDLTGLSDEMISGLGKEDESEV